MIGSVVFATEQGLGYLAKSFYDNGVIDKVLIRPHSSRETHYEWYGDDAHQENTFWEGLDAVLLFETAHYQGIYTEAKRRGVRTVLMPMYECTMRSEIIQADYLVNPSELDQLHYPQGKFIPVPVDVPWKQRDRARTFVHNAGHGGIYGRNGTLELVEATKNLDFDVEIRSQTPIEGAKTTSVPYDKLFDADVFVFPEKFNGLSLPLQEAFASGMLVIATNRFPNDTYLPVEPLIPVKGYEFQSGPVNIEVAKISPLDISKTLEFWYDKDISEYSRQGKKFAETRSWDKLREKYLEICLA